MDLLSNLLFVFVMVMSYTPSKTTAPGPAPVVQPAAPVAPAATPVALPTPPEDRNESPEP